MTNSTPADSDRDLQLGRDFANALAGRTSTTPQLRQAVLVDLLGEDRSLWPALRHLVEQPGFEAMLQEPNEAIRQAQRDALLHELETWCNAAILRRMERFLNGMLKRDWSEPTPVPGEHQNEAHEQDPWHSDNAPQHTPPATPEGQKSAQPTTRETAELLTHQAREFSASGNHEEAIRLCTRALELTPNRIETLMLRARAYSLNQSFSLAIRDYDRILGFQPMDPDALAECGRAKASLGQIESAKQDWVKAWRLGHQRAGT